jgi:hypothetical protein
VGTSTVPSRLCYGTPVCPRYASTISGTPAPRCCYGRGVNPKFVQELLGHADIALTLNVYSHVLPDMGSAAAGAMDAALG